MTAPDAMRLSPAAASTLRQTEAWNRFTMARQLAWKSSDPRDELIAREAYLRFEAVFVAPPPAAGGNVVPLHLTRG